MNVTGTLGVYLDAPLSGIKSPLIAVGLDLFIGGMIGIVVSPMLLKLLSVAFEGSSDPAVGTGVARLLMATYVVAAIVGIGIVAHSWSEAGDLKLSIASYRLAISRSWDIGWIVFGAGAIPLAIVLATSKGGRSA